MKIVKYVCVSVLMATALATPRALRAEGISIGLSTTPGGTVVLGSSTDLSDSATVTGGEDPSGTLTFYLFAPGVTPNGPDTNSVYSDVITLPGDGTFSTSEGTNPGGFLPSVTGTYEWVVNYSGGGGVNPASSPFGEEPETVVGTVATPEASALLLLSFGLASLGLLLATRRARLV